MSVVSLEKDLSKGFLKTLKREAFDEVRRVWGAEMAVLSYPESFTLRKLMILLGAVDNRRLIEKMISGMEGLKRELEELRKGLK